MRGSARQAPLPGPLTARWAIAAAAVVALAAFAVAGCRPLAGPIAARADGTAPAASARPAAPAPLATPTPSTPSAPIALTLAELAAGPERYDGRRVAVTGVFADGVWGRRDCYRPAPAPATPTVVAGGYAPHRSTWGLRDGREWLGVVVLVASTVDSTLPPHLSTGQALALEGVVRISLVQDACVPRLFHRITHLEIAGAQVGLPAKPVA